MNGRSVIVLTPLAALLAACSMIGAQPSSSIAPSDQPASSAATAAPSARPTGTPASELDGRQFVSLTVDQDGKLLALVPGTRVRLTFSAGNVAASAGCNTMSGDYRIVDDKLVVGELATTEMGCPANLQAQDVWLASLLSARPQLALDGPSLVLTSDTTVLTLVDREVAEPDQPLAGITWGLTTIIDGDVASSVPAGVSPTILFMDNGTFQFNDGCNAGGGEYTVDGDKLHFTQVVSTMMACPGDRGSVSGSVSSVLNGDPIDFSIDGTTLTLKFGDRALEYDAAVDVTQDPSSPLPR